MTIEGVDFSWGRPGGAALAASGKVFAVRYLLGDGQGGKGLDASEIADYQAHGVAVVACFEINADGWRGGHAQGMKDGAAALAQMRGLHFPTDRPCYFAVDRNVTAADFATVDAYLSGCVAAMGSVALVGVYGEADLIDHVASSGSAAFRWQTYAWSGGRLSQHAHLFQYHNGTSINGAAVDLDRGEAADFGQWPAPSAPKPVPAPPSKYRVHIKAPTPGPAVPLYDRPYGKVVGFFRNATFITSLYPPKPGRRNWYRIEAGLDGKPTKFAGKYLPQERNPPMSITEVQ